MLGMLALSAWIRRAPSEVWQARRAAWLAARSADLARTARSEPDRRMLRLASSRLAHQSRVLYARALWLGLTWGPAIGRRPYDDQDLIDELGLMRDRETLIDLMKRAGRPIPSDRDLNGSLVWP
jgi:hypothetical protein